MSAKYSIVRNDIHHYRLTHDKRFLKHYIPIKHSATANDPTTKHKDTYIK